MDEASTDTTKHRCNVIADAASIIRMYSETPEGDNKMNMHIAACLTTRADGKFFRMGRLLRKGIVVCCH